MTSNRRLFAVIPAAGHSRRMGRPKLLLPLGGKTVLARLLDALQHPVIAARIVVTRGDAPEVAAEARAHGATVVQTEIDPPDMRTSVEHALRHVGEQHRPGPDDGWLLVPADHPVLDRDLLDALITQWDASDCPILIPTYRGRRGHPAFFRWSLAADVASIPLGRGLNWLVGQYATETQRLEVDSPAILTDLDTPDDYARLQREFGD